MVKVDKKNKKLILNYKPKTSNSKFDICDMYGNIICIQNITSLEVSETCLKKLKKGIYQICIIDGTDLIVKYFEVK